jgi:hypothetical protein
MLKDPNVSQFDATAEFLRKFERPADQSDKAVQGRLNKGLTSLGAKGGGSPGYGANFNAGLAGNTKNVYIEVKFDQANEANAMVFAKKVQSYLDERNNISTIGQG